MKSNNSFYFAVSLIFITVFTFIIIKVCIAHSASSQKFANVASISDQSKQPDASALPSQTAAQQTEAQNVSVQAVSDTETHGVATPVKPVSLQEVKKIGASDFQNKVLNPDLKKLNIYSPSISNLLLGTAIQESLIGHLSKNIFQISLSTAKDINADYLAKHPDLKKAVSYFYYPKRPLSWNLSNNVNYEVAVASLVYLKTNQPLPTATNPEALGQFWKINYNTYDGKGTAQQYVIHLENYISKNPQLAEQFHA